MAKKLLDIKDPELFTSGIVKSLHPLQVPLWADGQDVIFEDGQVRKAPGYQKVTTVAKVEPIIGLIDVLHGNVPNIFYGNIDTLYRWNAQDGRTTDGTGYLGAINLGAFQSNAFQFTAFQIDSERLASQWSMENWGNWVLATNGIDPIQINKLDGNGFVDLTGTPPSSAQILVRLKNFMLAFNTDLGGEWFEWCDLDNVEQWDPDADQMAAGGLPIRDLDSEIIAAERLGDVIGAYTGNTMAIVQYIGPDFYFGAKRVLEGIGAVSKLCVVERESTHYGLSKQGFWRTDGASFDYISPPLLREWLEENVNWNFASKVAGYLNEDRSLIEWGLPLMGGSGGIDITIGYNVDQPSWTFRSYKLTAGLRKGIFSYPIMGLTDGRVVYGEVGLNADGVAQQSFIQSKPFALSEYLDTFTVDYILTAFKDLVDNGVSIYVGIQQSLDDPITWTSALEPNSSMLPIFSPLGMDGRFVSFKLVSTALNDNFRLAGFQIFGSETGSWA